ncbi:hypothetical protein [Azospirillum largimobile]
MCRPSSMFSICSSERKRQAGRLESGLERDHVLNNRIRAPLAT